MAAMPPAYGIIPARFASTRFPGKPLADIHGKPMFWHVWNQAGKCGLLRKVILATDDERIESEAKKLGVPVVMTGSDHASGTDRVYEAAMAIGLSDDCIVVNIQGDEPALDPYSLSELLEAFRCPGVSAATLAHPISAEQAANPDRVKVVFAENRDALYFSRSPVPFWRGGENGPGGECYWGHIGLYAFTMSTLRRFVGLEPSRLERAEKLEQLRLLENNVPIKVVCRENGASGVDTPEDLERIRRLMAAEFAGARK